MCRSLLAQLEETVLQAVGVFGDTPILGTCEDETKLGLLVFLPGRRTARSATGADLAALAGRLEAALYHQLLKLQRLIPAPGRVVVGWGEGVYSSRTPVERLIAEITAEAAESSARRLATQQSNDRSTLRLLLVEEQLLFHYQPIVTGNGDRYGYEALVRGPPDLAWNRPEQLFGRAAEVGLLDELDRSCCLGAIRFASGKLTPSERLFINVLPSSLYDHAFVSNELPAALAAAGIPTNRVVLEVTEQHAIESLAVFQESLRRVVDQGMAIALDDVGTGNSNLHALLEIRPAFVKLDRQIIDGIATHSVKRQLAAALVAAATAMPAELIAEGVERPEDAEELKRLGIGLLQGFLFGRPAPF
jgi:EAL domain-containing protein (putative c-di-GMP-specific phosphodiesterase class I)